MTAEDVQVAGLSALMEDVNECGIERIPLLASPQGGVAERLKRFREASADREAGVVFRENKKENHPVCAEQGSFAASLLTAQPPLLAVMQGGEYASACNSFTPSGNHFTG